MIKILQCNVHPCTGTEALHRPRTDHRGSRVIALLFLDHGTRMGWGVSVTPRRLFLPEKYTVQHVRNVMTHAQKPDLVFQRNGRVHLNRRGCQFSRLLAVDECGSADSDCIDRVPTYSARLLATHSIRIFPLHSPPPRCVAVCHQVLNAP